VSVEGGRCSYFDGITSFKRDSALLKDTGAGGLSVSVQDPPLPRGLIPPGTIMNARSTSPDGTTPPEAYAARLVTLSYRSRETRSAAVAAGPARVNLTGPASLTAGRR
jgi:hypothetical protein